MFDEPEPLANKLIKSHKIGDPLEQNSCILIKESEIQIGLGWENPKKEKLEFDASLVCFNSKVVVLDYVFYHRLKVLDGAIVHLGDKASSDKQIIKICLDKLPEEAHYLAVTLHSETKDGLEMAKNMYLRLFTKKEKIGKCIFNH